jgi:hypothetical protein
MDVAVALIVINCRQFWKWTSAKSVVGNGLTLRLLYESVVPNVVMLLYLMYEDTQIVLHCFITTLC